MKRLSPNGPVDVEEIPGLAGYLASRDGRIWTDLPANGRGGRVEMVREKIATERLRESGNVRLEVCLSIHGKRLYRRVGALILETFVGPRPDGMEVCHRDDDGINNAAGNLYWGTPTQNAADRARNGGTVDGERHHFAKLTNEQMGEIKHSGDSDSPEQAAQRFGVSVGTVYRIRSGYRGYARR